MLNKQEIEEYIAELNAQKDHTAGDFHLLSSFYNIMDHAFEKHEENYIKAYSQAPAPKNNAIEQYGDSDFLVVIAGKLPAEAWGIMDDLMDTLRVANPRVYDGVMRKLKKL